MLGAGPTTVTEDVKLWYDAASPMSYNGGTVIRDLAGISSNGTFGDFPGYTPDNRGTLTFNGTSQSIDFTAPSLSNKITIEVWCKVLSPNTNRVLFGWYIYGLYWSTTNNFGFNTGAGDVYGLNQATLTSLGIVGQWRHMVFVMNDNVSYTNNKMYVNAELQSLAQQQGAESVSERHFNSGAGRLAGWRLNPGSKMTMDCAIFKIYNRELSQEEVDNNFHAIRRRFSV